ncbi:MAG: divalent-cation tolerance protein CutA [Acidobacteriota bacterium]|nr:MAG: divalent-cation tolerance protein CutA [Acidobacteriota bacterium]
MEDKLVIVLTTVNGKDEGAALARGIVERRLAACVQILPPMTSVYRWDEKIQEETEHLLLIKTLSSRWDDLRLFIVENHSYSVPEIVVLDAAAVSVEYADWLRAELAG